MSKKLLYIFAALLLFACTSHGQVYDGYEMDSSYITFDTMEISDFVTDSSNIWQIGNTGKTFFSLGSSPVRSIMTDTINYYPANAYAWFQIGFSNWGLKNAIVNFKHKYETDSLRDGCIVEFSTDSGATWENVKGNCNGDGNGSWSMVYTDNLYSNTDTLLTGEMAFTGTSNGWIKSRVQFFTGIAIKSSDSTHLCNTEAAWLLLRFRFVSDSIPDSLDGWIIDSIQMEQDSYPGYVGGPGKIKNSLDIHPNPSHDGIINFPNIPFEKEYKIEIVNSIGQSIYRCDYQRRINLNKYPKGVYFYRVTNNVEYFSGQLLLE